MVGLIPYIDGVIFKKNYYHFVDVMNKDGHINVTILNYQRGWMNSCAKIRITINKNLFDFYQPSPIVTPLISFIIEENIIHGPIVYDRIKNRFKLGYANIESNIFLTDALKKMLPGMFIGPDIIFADMLSEFDGDWSGHVLIHPLAFTLQNVGNITWEGVDSDFKIGIRNEHIKHIRNDLSSGLFVIDINNSAIKKILIEPVQYSYDVARQKTGLWSGNSKIDMLGFMITRSNGPMISSNKLSLQSTFSMDETTFYNTNLSIFFDDLKIPDYFISDISTFRLMVRANNFSTHGLNEYLTNLTPTILPVLDLNQIETMLAHTVTTTSDIHGSINFSSSLGNMTTKFKIDWEPNVPAPDTISNIITGTYTEADVTASKPFIIKLLDMYMNGSQFKNQLMDQKTPASAELNLKDDPKQSATKTPQESLIGLEIIGYVSKDKEDNYSTEFTVKNGIPKINGRDLLHK